MACTVVDIVAIDGRDGGQNPALFGGRAVLCRVHEWRVTNVSHSVTFSEEGDLGFGESEASHWVFIGERN
jgi:hypothetical protein